MALTYHNNNSISNIPSFPQVPSGSPVLLSTATASGSSSISFTSGIDSTYDVYQFEFINIHPSGDTDNFQFQTSINSGSSYGVTATTTVFNAYHNESDSATALGYQTSFDLAQSTSFQLLAESGNDNDQNCSGYLHIFNPSSTTYVKHFISRASMTQRSDYQQDHFTAGYFNTQSAIDAVQFKMSSGNIDAGTIKMYGIKA